MQDVEQRLRRLAGECLGAEPSRIAPGTDLARDLDVDSLDVVEFVMAVEKEFGVELPDESLEGGTTLQDLVDHVRSVAA